MQNSDLWPCVSSMSELPVNPIIKSDSNAAIIKKLADNKRLLALEKLEEGRKFLRHAARLFEESRLIKNSEIQFPDHSHLVPDPASLRFCKLLVEIELLREGLKHE